jgi:hypothetical protein
MSAATKPAVLQPPRRCGGGHDERTRRPNRGLPDKPCA